uniref:Retrovirus-related Pol polyprotein from transposon TNT 1-94 n=1 Tax=Tanacetum cinerariifolium TaxID=118510 RepID=A0A699J961_TANCI|nr:retrovirus-related Pol polyprotein from transposon TNT 1-94 [Tanacetum cinerariifolium]
MCALLIQHGCEAALEVLPIDMEAEAKDELNKKAHSAKALTLEDVMATLNLKEIKERSKANGVNGEGLYVRGRTHCRDLRQLRGQSRSKSRGELYASVEEKDSLTQVWHKRLGHISEARLQVLEKQRLFGKKSLGKLNFCENCVLEKSHRVSFDVGRHTTQEVIDYVHLDLLGPSQVELLGGKMYFLSIVDDYFRRVWVYILRFKHEAFGKFKKWKQLVENQTGRTVKKLRKDNGLEFYNQEFEQLLRPKTLWTEATCTAAYLINRSPSTAIEKNTPMKMWSGHPCDYEMLRVFGRVAYSHVKQGKLEPRAVTCVFLGYPEGVKGYRLYRLDNESPKIVTSRHVIFNESVMYKGTLKDSGACTLKSIEKLQVKVELQGLNNRTLEEDHTD